MEENDNMPWVEKYRPTCLEDIVLDPINRTIFDNIIKMRYFPNILFYGPPGTGKTSSILNLIQKWNYGETAAATGTVGVSTSIGEKPGGTPTQPITDTAEAVRRNQMKERVNIIHLNASDERGIEIIRNQITQFIHSKSLFDAGMKFVILDEVDYMTKPAQQAFKNLIQSFSSRSSNNHNVRFCLICNYLSKLDETLRHEFMEVRFNQLPPKQIHAFISNIARRENIPLTQSDIEIIQKTYNSDIRSMINYIQTNQRVLSSSEPMQNGCGILTDGVWDEFHGLCFDSSGSVLGQRSPAADREAAIKRKLQEMSILFNLDKKQLLKRYFHYLTTRPNSELMTVKNMGVIRSIVHYTEATAEEQIIFFVHHFCD